VITVFLRRLFGLIPSDPFTEGLQRMQRGDLRGAAELFEPLLDAPDDGIRKMARLYTCEALLQLGDRTVDEDPVAALECYESASGLQPTFADIHQRIGRIRLAHDDPVGAVEAFDRALEINPRFFGARLDALQARVEMGRDDCEAVLEALETHAPPLFHDEIADARRELEADDPGAALVRILAMRDRNPEPRDRAKERAIIALQDGAPLRAIELLERMLDDGRRFPDLLHLLGLAHGALDQHESAERAFREAIAIHPGYTKARMNLALTLMELERYAEADAQLNDVLRCDPHHPLALSALDEIRARAGGN